MPRVTANGYTITYTVSDGNGGTDMAVVTVTVGPQNDPPVANNDATSTSVGSPITINVLANDVSTTSTINPATVVVTAPTGGTAVANPKTATGADDIRGPHLRRV